MKKFISMIMFSVLLAAFFLNTAAFAASTTATVAFTEGVPEFGDASLDGLHNMDIDFGTRDLPIGAQTYAAVDHDHTLRIMDARSDGNAGNWNVTVSLSAFSSTTITPSNSFTGTIAFTSPTLTSGLTASSPLSITSGAAAQTVVTAAANLNKANYDTTWQKTNITLSFDAASAASITKPDTYTANLTWTLITP